MTTTVNTALDMRATTMFDDAGPALVEHYRQHGFALRRRLNFRDHPYGRDDR